MATWGSRGLRGSLLEEMINYTIEDYRERGLALIQKVPTPITPIEIDAKTRHITLAYFEKQSTVDYIGAVQGIPVCFDAKECEFDTFPLANVHEHQVKFMGDMEKQEGIAFLVIYYTKKDEAYYLPYRDLKRFWDRMESGGRKSFTFDEIDKTYRISVKSGVFVHFLEALQLDLISREGGNASSENENP